MEFLKVSDAKLKIMITKAEMTEYGVDGESIDYDTPKIRRAFWRILDKAREECGFEVLGDKVLIQFYPSKDGGEIFITKLGLASERIAKTVAKSERVTMLLTRRAMYRFPSYFAFCEAERLGAFCEGAGRRDLYLDERGQCYLITEERGGKKDGEISPLLEFAVEIPDTLIPYVREHLDKVE